MSLVSYGASSSSEESEAEEETPQVKQPPATEPSQKPAPESKPSSQKAALEPKPSSQKKSLFSSLPPPKGLSNKLPPPKSTSGADTSSVGPPKKKSLFATLPPPKSSGASTTNEKTQGSGLKLPPPKKKAQSVKISLPALPDPDSDDDDEPVVKKPKPAQGVAGLFAQLPKPKHAAAKESNRIMIPYTLTKRKPPPKPAQLVKKAVKEPKPTPKTSNITSLVTGYDDDDDDDEEEDSGFFSLDKKDVINPTLPEPTATKTSVTSTTDIKQDSRTNSEHIAPKKLKKSNEKQEQQTLTSTTQQSVNDGEYITDLGTSDESLDFDSASQNSPVPVYGRSSGAQAGDSDAPLSFSSGSQQQYGYYQQQASGYAAGQYSGDYSYPYGAYNQPYTGEDQNQQVVSAGETSQASQQQQRNLMQDKEFQKMMGKHNRGKGAIDIIDVNADEQLGPNPGTEWMLKSMTEEKEYRGNLKKEQLPSSQQKRKHQITYLAHQAKEREMALKNQWANNRMTRKETQAKYGF